MIRDLRYGVRILWKNPGFTLIAGFTLALGVGLSAAIFSLTHSVLLRALRCQLYGVGSADVFALTLAPSLLLLTALLAGLGPALKAGRVDPAGALRSE